MASLHYLLQFVFICALLRCYLFRSKMFACHRIAMQVEVNKKSLSEWDFSFAPPLSVDKWCVCVGGPCTHSYTHMVCYDEWRLWLYILMVIILRTLGQIVISVESLFFFLCVFFVHINNKHIYMSFRSLSSTHFFCALARSQFSIHNMFWLWLGAYFHYYWSSLIDAHSMHFVHSIA